MTDGIIKGTGNSRYLKSSIPAGTTWEQALAMLTAGTFPIDLNGINAAGWQQLATALGKANLLSDAAAAAFNPDAPTTPSAALQLLARFNGGLGNEWVWEKIHVEYIESRTNDIMAKIYYSNNYTPETQTLTFYDSIIIDQNTKEITGVNPTTFSGNYNEVQLNYSNYLGKYYKSVIPVDNQAPFSWFFIPNSATIYSYNGGPNPWHVSLKNSYGIRVASTITRFGYVNAPTSDAYPPAVPDGYTYMALGQVCSKVRMASGSYMGTGTYGKYNPNTLTFDFEPKLFMLFKYDHCLKAINSSNDNLTCFAMHGVPKGDYATIYGDKFFLGLSVDGNTVEWYTPSTSASDQMNANGSTYYFIAIG